MALIVIGLIAGALAKWVMPGPDPGGIIITILIGIVGSFVGGFVVQLRPSVRSSCLRSTG